MNIRYNNNRSKNQKKKKKSSLSQTLMDVTNHICMIY